MNIRELEHGISHKNHIDLLARLVTSHYRNRNKKYVCVAVCSHNNKLFIASNRGTPEYAKEWLEDLQKIIKNPSPMEHGDPKERVEIYKKLMKKAAEKIRYIELKSKSSSVILKDFKYKARECSEAKKPDWSGLQALAKKLFREVKEPSKDTSLKNHKWKFLMPWHEVGEIVLLIIEKKFDDFLKSSIEHCENKVVYVGNEDEERSLNKEIPIHAEMKIVNKLYIKKGTKEIQEIRYIGCTKKACIYCQAIIDVFNKDGKYIWVNYGTHGDHRFEFKNPSIVSKYNKEQEVKDRIKQIKSRGLDPCNSSTSEIPKTLTNPLKLLDKIRGDKQE